MREMTNGTTTIKVVEHIILRNFWEYYVTTEKFTDDIICCFVVGDFPELGDVSMQEIAPYIISRTKKLDEIMPAPGWKWGEKCSK